MITVFNSKSLNLPMPINMVWKGYNSNSNFLSLKFAPLLSTYDKYEVPGNIMSGLNLTEIMKHFELYYVSSPSSSSKSANTLPPHDLYFLLHCSQLTVPGLNVQVEAVPEMGSGCETAHVSGNIGNYSRRFQLLVHCYTFHLYCPILSIGYQTCS